MAVQMMRYKVELVGEEKRLWREIEISSNAELDQFCYALLASVEAQGNHLFSLTFKEKEYEIFSENRVYNDIRKYALKNIDWKIGESATLIYDYGCEWNFKITLLFIEDMKKGMGNRYPYVTDGAGRGIIEDVFIKEYTKLLNKMVLDKNLQYKYIIDDTHVLTWRYDTFNSKTANILLRGDIIKLLLCYNN